VHDLETPRAAYVQHLAFATCRILPHGGVNSLRADAVRNPGSCSQSSARARYSDMRIAPSFSKRLSLLTPVFMRPSSEAVPRSSRWLEPRRRPEGSECSSVGRNRVARCVNRLSKAATPNEPQNWWKLAGSSPSQHRVAAQQWASLRPDRPEQYLQGTSAERT